MKNVILLILGISIFFTGCGVKVPEPKIIYEKEFIKILPPNELLRIQPVPLPPNRDEFIKSKDADRIKMLSIYNIKLLKEIDFYKSSINSIKAWKKEVEKQNE